MKTLQPARQSLPPAGLAAVAAPLLMLALVIAGIGFYVYVSAREAATHDVAGNMAAIGRLKTGQIRQWLHDRAIDAAIASSQISADLERWLDSEMRSPTLESRLRGQLRRFADAGGYSDVSLHSAADGRLLLTTAGQPDLPTLRAEARRVTELRRTVLEDFHAADRDGKPSIDIGFFSPVIDEGNARVLGVIHVTKDAETGIFPLLQEWPGVSTTGETLLLRREGDEVLYLNALRHISDSALRLRRPLSAPHFIAASVIREGEGFFQGDDYRGVPVLAHGLPVHGTPWYLVAKIDRDEAFAQLYKVTNFSAILLFVLLLVSAWWLIYRNRMESALLASLEESGRSEAAQSRLNRSIRLLSQCNSMLVHSQVEHELLHSICRVIVDMGGYRMAWVGFAEQDTNRTVRIASRYGDDNGYLDDIAVSWADDEHGLGPTGTAIRTGVAQFNRDFRDNPLTSPWRQAALARGYLSSIALPLEDKYGIFGALTIYAERADAFSGEEAELLEELADNLAFGIFALRTSAARRRAEDSLRKLSRAVEQSPESIIITDLETTIEYVNDAFVEVSGYSKEEIIGRKPSFLSSGNTPPETYASLWAALQQGKAWKGEFYNRRKDGSEYVEFAVVAPIRQPSGTITHYVALKEDITEKKRLGLELDRHRDHLEDLVEQRTAELAMAKAAAEAANIAKSAFLANMSHEIRTPMNAIIGLTRQLRKDVLTSAQEERVGKIDTAAGHLMSIINDILDFSKIEAGKLVLEHTNFPLGAILDQVRALIAEAAETKNLTIEVDRGDVPDWLRGDPTRLRQALLNFASNAVKFTERGSIHLSAAVVEQRNDDITVRFVVRDSGIGIAASQLPQLFQPFHQADATTTRRFGGTGLGLAITQRLAALMGGEARVASEPGVGSTFWFTARLGHGCPADSATADVMDARALICERHCMAHVLLVEDDALNREIALSLLAEAGLNADVASDGVRAVGRAATTHYDLILMDMQMPEMDGVGATRTIRALPGRAAIPILAITANAFDEDRQRCLDAGMNDFITKPLDPQIFYSTLLKWLSAQAPAAPRAHSAAAPQAQDALRQCLADIPGLDVERVLRGMPGRIASYMKLLWQYVDTCERDGHIFSRHAAAGDFPEAAHLAHSLKGNAGFLGLTRIQATADALETAVREQFPPEEIERLAGAIDVEQARLVAALRAVLPDRTTVTTK